MSEDYCSPTDANVLAQNSRTCLSFTELLKLFLRSKKFHGALLNFSKTCSGQQSNSELFFDPLGQAELKKLSEFPDIFFPMSQARFANFKRDPLSFLFLSSCTRLCRKTYYLLNYAERCLSRRSLIDRCRLTRISSELCQTSTTSNDIHRALVCSYNSC